MAERSLLERLKKAKPEQFAQGFLSEYLTPAFGARSKSEVDLLVFKQLVDCGVIALTEPVYEIARVLNVTPTRVRSLILQVQLRSGLTDTALDDQLRGVLKETRFGKDGNLLAFGLESPLLKEHLVARLRKRNIYADTSFAKEIVRLPVDAFVEFLDEILAPAQKKEITGSLVQYKLVPDKSFKGVVKGVLKKVVGKVADESGGELTDIAIDRLTDFVRGLIGNDSSAMTGALDKLGIQEIGV